MTTIIEEEVTSAGERAARDKSVEGGDGGLLADIARRAGEFTRSVLDLARWARLRRLRKRPAFPVERALEYCDAGFAVSEVPGFVRTILEFERALVRARHMACQSVGEVEETSQGMAVH